MEDEKKKKKYMQALAEVKGVESPRDKRRDFQHVKTSGGELKKGGDLKDLIKRKLKRGNDEKDWRVGDRIEHRSTKMKTGSSIYNDPDTFKDAAESKTAKKVLKKSGSMLTKKLAKTGLKALPLLGTAMSAYQAMKSGDAAAAIGPENVGQGSELKESERDKAIERARKMWKKRQQK